MERKIVRKIASLCTLALLASLAAYLAPVMAPAAAAPIVSVAAAQPAAPREAPAAASIINVQATVNPKVLLTLDPQVVATAADGTVTLVVSGTIKANTTWQLLARVPPVEGEGFTVVASGGASPGYHFSHVYTYRLGADKPALADFAYLVIPANL